jgi:hypothetical protein
MVVVVQEAGMSVMEVVLAALVEQATVAPMKILVAVVVQAATLVTAATEADHLADKTEPVAAAVEEFDNNGAAV